MLQKEILDAAKIARIVRCQPAEVRHKMREGDWKFGRVIRPGPGRVQYRYEATINETAKYFDLSREEAVRRLETG